MIMSTREDIAARSITVSGIPDSVDARDFVNTLVSQQNLKQPLCVRSSHVQRGDHVALLQAGPGGIDRLKLLLVKENKYQGRLYDISLRSSTEEEIPEAWLCDPPDFTTVTASTDDSVSKENENSEQFYDTKESPEHITEKSPETETHSAATRVENSPQNAQTIQTPHGTNKEHSGYADDVFQPELQGRDDRSENIQFTRNQSERAFLPQELPATGQGYPPRTPPPNMLQQQQIPTLQPTPHNVRHGLYYGAQPRPPYGEAHIRPPYGEAHIRLPYGEAHIRPNYGEAHIRPPYGEAHIRPPYGEAHIRPPYGEAHIRPPYGEAHIRPPYMQGQQEPQIPFQPPFHTPYNYGPHVPNPPYHIEMPQPRHPSQRMPGMPQGIYPQYHHTGFQQFVSVEASQENLYPNQAEKRQKDPLPYTHGRPREADESTRTSPSVSPSHHTDPRKSDTKPPEQKVEGPFIIEVTKLPPNTTEDALMMYFENKRRSGGGEVTKVVIDKKMKKMALVYFVQSDAAQRVLKQKSHTIDNQQIHVSPHIERSLQASKGSSPNTSDNEEDHCTIEVRGFKPGTSDETFEMYFENTRRGGGESVTGIERKDDVIYVTFATSEEVTRVIEKKHEFDGKKLEVKVHIPKVCYKNRLLVSNLSSTTTKDSLQNYIEARSKCEVTDIVYGEQAGNALVTFDNETIPDLIKLRQALKQKPLQGKVPEVSTIPIADSIVVQGFSPETTEETISNYFESRRSGNVQGSEVTVTIHSEKCYCLVQFEDYKVADAVVSKPGHRIEGSPLSVSLYIECLGISRNDENQSWYKQPEAFTLESLNKYKCMFLQQTKDQNLKNKLDTCFAEITWLSEDSATLKCTLTKDISDAVNKAKTWKKGTEECIRKYFEKIVVKDRTTLSQIWDDVRTKLKTIKTSTAEAKMFISDTKSKVVIVGYKEAVPTLVDEVHSVVGAVEEEFNRKQQEITETVSSLKPIQLRLLLALGFHTEMKKNYKDLEVTIKLKQNEILFKGQVKDITQSKLNMFERITSFCAKNETGFSKSELEFLDQREVKDTIVNKMKGKNLFGVWETETTVLLVLSTSEEDAVSVVKVIREVVIEHTETLEPESTFLLNSQKWFRLVDQITKDHGNVVKINTSPETGSVTIVAIHSIAHGVRAQIQEYIAENSIFSRVIKIPKPVYRFLLLHAEEDIKQTANRIERFNGKITYSNDTPQITVTGSKDGLNEAVKELTRIAKRVITQKRTLKRAGIGKYIHSEKIKLAIADTEKKDRCVIELEFNKTETVSVEGGSTERSPQASVHSEPSLSGVAHFASCNIGIGRCIDVVMGDMTTMEVDVIVNAANNRLDHVGGLARAIAVKGGPSIQRESDEYIKKHKNVRAGDAVPTGPGRLPCKMVVHAVGPVWSGGRQGEERDLKDAVMGSMECADRKGYKSIVLPALSGGIFGYPIELATKHIVEAIETFYRLESPNSGLTNVYLVDVSPKSVNHFVTALQDVFSDKKVKLTGTKRDTLSGPPVNKPPIIKPKPTKRLDRVFPSEEPKSVLHRPIKISLVKGEIAKQRVDVIVNSTSNNLDLTNGAVSKSILNAGGQSLQSELKKNYPDGIQAGDIAVSSGGNLHCQEVFHSCLPSWTLGNNAKFLDKLVSTCLQQASDSGFSSIAFPALGTGNLGYPRDVVAQTMYTTVAEFQQRNRSLKQVSIVIYHGDKETIKAFENCEEKVSSGQSFEPPSLTSKHSRRFQTEDEEENRAFDTAKETVVAPVNPFKIDLVKGEISRQMTDVIVNSTASNLDLNSGAVAKSLLLTGGNSLQSELRANYPNGIQLGEVAETSGGKLQCMKVYHTCLSNWTNDSSRQSLEDLIESCLRKASDGGLKSIAFPALGTGNLGYPRNVVARSMYTAMANFQHRNKSIKEAKIVIYHKDTLTIEAFEEYEKQRAMGGGEPLPPVPTEISQRMNYRKPEYKKGNDGIHIGRIRLEVKQGDITKENADCIINSTNPELDFRKGAVSNAIAKTCGKELEQQCKQKAKKMRKNGLISTTAAGLNCKYVIHVAADHFSNNWTAVVKACLEEADKLGDAKSVAFPLLGTGAGHVNPQEMAKLMAQAVDQFETHAVNIDDVRVVVFQKVMLDPFTTQIQESASGIQKASGSKVYATKVSPDTADLYFFSDDQKSIDNGFLTLTKKCDSELKSRSVDDTVIGKLNDEQIRKLKDNFDVDLVVDRSRGKVQITGLAAEVGDVLIQVTTYLRDIEKMEGEEERATLLSRSVQWSYIYESTVTDFDKISNAHIEKEFESKCASCKVNLPKGELKIDFSSLQGTMKGNKKDSFNIIRRDLFKEASKSIFDPPKTWQSMTDDVNFVHVDVANTDAEFTEVSSLFLQTVGVQTAKVHNVRRIQNRALYQQYTAKLKQLEKQNPPGTVNERRLWHGTSTDAIASINMHGYNRSYCGKNATAYGQGVYFAVNANYSASNTYSRPDSQGNKYMYLARVLTGVYVTGNSSMRIPPVKPHGKGAHDLCDSVVNDANKPIMFIVFNDTQAYPEYLVTFTL